MCNSIFNHHLAPLNKKHLEKICEIFPSQVEFAKKVYEVLTKNLKPQVNLLVSFVILKHQYDSIKKGIFGEFGRVLYAPLSIVSKTGDHEWTRFRPKPVEELHTSFLSFMMAKPNRESLNILLNQYELCFSQGHCCGILFGEIKDVERYESSDLFKTRNLVRSYAESMAMPVTECDFESIPIVTSDLGKTEAEFYSIYEETFNKMGTYQLNDYRDVSIESSWNLIISKMTNPISIKDSGMVKTPTLTCLSEVKN